MDPLFTNNVYRNGKERLTIPSGKVWQLRLWTAVVEIVLHIAIAVLQILLISIPVDATAMEDPCIVAEADILIILQSLDVRLIIPMRITIPPSSAQTDNIQDDTWAEGVRRLDMVAIPLANMSQKTHDHGHMTMTLVMDILTILQVVIMTISSIEAPERAVAVDVTVGIRLKAVVRCTVMIQKSEISILVGMIGKAQQDPNGAALCGLLVVDHVWFHSTKAQSDGGRTRQRAVTTGHQRINRYFVITILRLQWLVAWAMESTRTPVSTHHRHLTTVLTKVQYSFPLLRSAVTSIVLIPLTSFLLRLHYLLSLKRTCIRILRPLILATNVSLMCLSVQQREWRHLQSAMILSKFATRCPSETTMRHGHRGRASVIATVEILG